MFLSNLIGKTVESSISNKQAPRVGEIVKTMSNQNSVGISSTLAEKLGVAKGNYVTYHKVSEKMLVGDTAINFRIENPIVATAGFANEKVTVGNKLGLTGQFLQCNAALAWTALGGVKEGERDGGIKTKTTYAFDAKVAVAFSLEEKDGSIVAYPIYDTQEASEVVAIFVQSSDNVVISFVAKENINAGFKFVTLAANPNEIVADARDEDESELDSEGNPVTKTKKGGGRKKKEVAQDVTDEAEKVSLDLDEVEFDDVETEEEVDELDADSDFSL